MDLNYLLCLIFCFRSDFFLMEKTCISISKKGRVHYKIELYFISRAILPWLIPKYQLTQVITRISFILNKDTG